MCELTQQPILTLSNVAMALGGIVSAILIIITLLKQQKNYRISRFESRYFGMIDRLVSNINNLSLTIKLGSQDKLFQGIDVLIHLSSFNKEAIKEHSEEAMLKGFTQMKRLYHSQLHDLFGLICFIIDYHDKYNPEATYDYYKYLKLNINEHFKFIIALYFIYDKNCKLTKEIIEKLHLIDLDYSFKTFIKEPEHYKNFMEKFDHIQKNDD